MEAGRLSEIACPRRASVQRTVTASQGTADPPPPAIPMALQGRGAASPEVEGEANPAPSAGPGRKVPLRSRLAAASA